jgi:hypothetical protein
MIVIALTTARSGTPSSSKSPTATGWGFVFVA